MKTIHLLTVTFAGILSAIIALPFAPAFGEDSAPGKMVLRVLTYNIHHGAGMDGKIDLARTAEVIKAARPDLVALQEVDQNTRRAGGVDQAATLGELTGLRAAFGRAMDYDGGRYGQAILSKYPLGQTETHPLPTDKGFEPRALLAAEVQPQAGGPKILFFGTHLDHTKNPDQRQRQAEKILEIAGKTPSTPMILAGDFNAEPDDPPVQTLLKQWTDPGADRRLLTWRADKPTQRIDFIFFRPAGRFRAVETRVIDEPAASDHRPVLAVLELQEAT